MAKARYHDLLAAIRYKDWCFAVNEMESGWFYLQVVFQALNHETGVFEPQHGRKWLLSPHMTKSELVQTAFKAVLTAEEHEARENFFYQGKPVFGPHLDVEALLEVVGRKDARA